MAEDTQERTEGETGNPREAGGLAKAARIERKRKLARKIAQLMYERDWRQADLARHSGLNKDVISTTLSGRTYPTLLTLKALAQTFGIPVTDLSVAYEDPVVNHANVEMGAYAIAGQPGRMRLTINKSVPTAVALQVLQLIEGADANAADRG